MELIKKFIVLARQVGIDVQKHLLDDLLLHILIALSLFHNIFDAVGQMTRIYALLRFFRMYLLLWKFRSLGALECLLFRQLGLLLERLPLLGTVGRSGPTLFADYVSALRARHFGLLKISRAGISLLAKSRWLVLQIFGTSRALHPSSTLVSLLLKRRFGSCIFRIIPFAGTLDGLLGCIVVGSSERWLLDLRFPAILPEHSFLISVLTSAGYHDIQATPVIFIDFIVLLNNPFQSSHFLCFRFDHLLQVFLNIFLPEIFDVIFFGHFLFDLLFLDRFGFKLVLLVVKFEQFLVLRLLLLMVKKHLLALVVHKLLVALKDIHLVSSQDRDSLFLIIFKLFELLM